MFQNGPEKVFVIKNFKNAESWTSLLVISEEQKNVGTFYEKELQKTNQKKFRIHEVIKGKGDKIYVKWKGYDNSLNSWIDKEDIII